MLYLTLTLSPLFFFLSLGPSATPASLYFSMKGLHLSSINLDSQEDLAGSFLSRYAQGKSQPQSQLLKTSTDVE